MNIHCWHGDSRSYDILGLLCILKNFLLELSPSTEMEITLIVSISKRRIASHIMGKSISAEIPSVPKCAHSNSILKNMPLTISTKP